MCFTIIHQVCIIVVREIIHMKKTIAVLFVAFVLVSSVFAAFSFKSVGVETGFGRHSGLFIAANMEAAKDLDVYARLGYTGKFNVTAGIEYKVAEIKLSSAKVPFKPGLQLDFNFGNGPFVFEALVTLGFEFGEKPFSAIVRPALGFAITKNASAFSWGVETGVALAL